MADVNLSNIGHDGRFLQFTGSGTDTMVIVDPTHQFGECYHLSATLVA